MTQRHIPIEDEATNSHTPEEKKDTLHPNKAVEDIQAHHLEEEETPHRHIREETAEGIQAHPRAVMDMTHRNIRVIPEGIQIHPREVDEITEESNSKLKMAEYAR